jgi:hypothetical protein
LALTIIVIAVRGLAKAPDMIVKDIIEEVFIVVVPEKRLFLGLLLLLYRIFQ